ncbi:integrin [Bdellovibrio sp. ZAP7]|uniref:integrin n=1 Tax=Bdellovibrio sp. ZAP7 TaxID=2231053 RepID=UPI00115A1672|nr:integrin [Bdellovibrio sp. ZAP7]QDK44862.1 integrin [Bdellovibrio sp. ZAP7]
MVLNSIYSRTIFTAATLSLILASCGRGLDSKSSGSSSQTPATPSTPATPAPSAPVLTMTYYPVKELIFDWTDSDSEDNYKFMMDATGSSGWTELSTLGQDLVMHQDSIYTTLNERIGAKYKIMACNTGGCTDSNIVTVNAPMTAAIGYFKASNSAASDSFGYKVAVSKNGTYMAVSATGEDSNATGVGGLQSNNSASGSGAVYIFKRDGSTWAQMAYIKPSNTASNMNFGQSLSLSDDGDYLAVGANMESTTAATSGAAYIFKRTSSTWAQQAFLKASNPEAADEFGISVDISGDGTTLAVGAYTEDSAASGINGDETSNAASAAGAAYVFTRSGTSWSQEAYIKASNPTSGDRFGASVSISADGTALAVGASQESSNATGVGGNQNNESAPASGAAYVFRKTNSVWSQQAYIKASNPSPYDNFANNLSLADDGLTLAVGSYGEASNATGVNSGNQADNSLSIAGAVYIFSFNGTVWSQQAYIKASNTKASLVFGWSVSLSADGNKLAVGAYQDNSSGTSVDGNQSDTSATSAGSAFLFSRTGTTWSQQAYFKAPNAEAQDYFGYSIALSGNGNYLCVGATGEDSSATGVGGAQTNGASAAGAVYVY